MQRNSFNFFTNNAPNPTPSYVVFSNIEPEEAKELLRQELIQLADNKKLKQTTNSRIWLIRESDKPCVLIVTWREYDYDLNNPRNINLHDDDTNTHKELIFTDQGWKLNDKGVDKYVVYTLNHSSQSEVNSFNALNYLFEQLELLRLDKSSLVLPHPNLAALDYTGYCMQHDKREDDKLKSENNEIKIEREKPDDSLSVLRQILTCPYSDSLMINAHTVLINQYNKDALLKIQDTLTEGENIFTNVMKQLIDNYNLNLVQINFNLDVNAQQLTIFNNIANGIIKIMPNFLAQALAKILANEKLSEEQKLQEIAEELNCPINFEKLQSPYLLPSGKTCEEKIIRDTRAKNRPDPMTNDSQIPLTDADLIPNKMISLFLEEFNKLVNVNNNSNDTNNTFRKKS